MADGQDRAAQVTDDDHAFAGLGATDRVADAVVVRAEAAIRKSARRMDRDVRPRHLGRQLCQPPGDVLAVRYQYQADHCSFSVGYST